jgi:hypothetical protein
MWRSRQAASRRAHQPRRVAFNRREQRGRRRSRAVPPLPGTGIFHRFAAADILSGGGTAANNCAEQGRAKRRGPGRSRYPKAAFRVAPGARKNPPELA